MNQNLELERTVLFSEGNLELERTVPQISWTLTLGESEFVARKDSSFQWRVILHNNNLCSKPSLKTSNYDMLHLGGCICTHKKMKNQWFGHLDQFFIYGPPVLSLCMTNAPRLTSSDFATVRSGPMLVETEIILDHY